MGLIGEYDERIAWATLLISYGLSIVIVGLVFGLPQGKSWYWSDPRRHAAAMSLWLAVLRVVTVAVWLLLAWSKILIPTMVLFLPDYCAVSLLLMEGIDESSHFFVSLAAQTVLIFLVNLLFWRAVFWAINCVAQWRLRS